VEVRDAVLQVLAVARPRLAIHAGSRVMLEGMISVFQQARRHVVQKSREPQRRVPPCCRTHPVQPTRRKTPARCPVRWRLARVPLGHRPSLPCLRRRAGTATPTRVGRGLPSPPFRLRRVPIAGNGRAQFRRARRPRRSRLCSARSQVLRRCQTSQPRTCRDCGHGPSPTVPGAASPWGTAGISRFSSIEFPHMPGSSTPWGRTATRV